MNNITTSNSIDENLLDNDDLEVNEVDLDDQPVSSRPLSQITEKKKRGRPRKPEGAPIDHRPIFWICDEKGRDTPVVITGNKEKRLLTLSEAKDYCQEEFGFLPDFCYGPCNQSKSTIASQFSLSRNIKDAAISTTSLKKATMLDYPISPRMARLEVKADIISKGWQRVSVYYTDNKIKDDIEVCWVNFQDAVPISESDKKKTPSKILSIIPITLLSNIVEKVLNT